MTIYFILLAVQVHLYCLTFFTPIEAELNVFQYNFKMSTVKKSYQEANPVKEYCIKHSTPLHPVQIKLMEHTLQHPRVVTELKSNFILNNLFQARMLGAPEVISLNGLLIKSLGAKKVLDIGVFTGASTLAAALALPDGKGRVKYKYYP